MTRVYVTEQHLRTAHIDTELEHTSIVVSSDLITITQRIAPAGYTGEGERELTLQVDELVEALRLLGLA